MHRITLGCIGGGRAFSSIYPSSFPHLCNRNNPCGVVGKVLKDIVEGPGEIAQWLQALTALVENMGLVLSTHMVTHNCL